MHVQKVKVECFVDHFGSLTEFRRTTWKVTAPKYCYETFVHQIVALFWKTLGTHLAAASMLMSMVQDYNLDQAALIIVCGTCVVFLLLLQPVEMVQLLALQTMCIIAQMKNFSPSTTQRIYVYPNEVKRTRISLID